MPKQTLPAAGLGLPHRLTRAAVEAAIDHLVDLLDFVDGDADAEDDDADAEDADEDDDRSDLEPSLGAPDGDGERGQTYWAEGDAADGELDDADLEDDGCAEPWLGAPLGDGSQFLWAQGDPRDLEATDTLDDVTTFPRGRTRAEAEMLRRLTAEALALAGRLRRKRGPVKPKRRADPAWIAALRPCR